MMKIVRVDMGNDEWVEAASKNEAASKRHCKANYYGKGYKLTFSRKKLAHLYLDKWFF